MSPKERIDRDRPWADLATFVLDARAEIDRPLTFHLIRAMRLWPSQHPQTLNTRNAA